MSISEAEQPNGAVATPSPDAGKKVWCENGCGDRILDPDERIPFPCPAGCGGVMTAEKPAVVVKKTRKVELPTLGRIVHVHVQSGLWRPAIVMGADPDGRLLVHCFKHESDMPGSLAEGTGYVTYGSGLGQWVWPSQEAKQQFEAEIE